MGHSYTGFKAIAMVSLNEVSSFLIMSYFTLLCFAYFLISWGL